MQHLRLGLLFLTSAGAIPIFARGGSCITENSACLKDSTTFIREYNNTNMDGCQGRCAMSDQCTYWTWWWDQEKCQLFTNCTEHAEDCLECESGPRSCGEEEKSVSIISGGLNKQNDIQTQNGVMVVSQNGLCHQPVFPNLTQMPRHRWGHVSTFLVSIFIVCGGSTDQNGVYAPNATCDMFSLNTKQWESMEDMQEPRHQAAGIGLLGKFYMTGGVALSDSRANVASMEVYCPYSGKWSPGPDMPRLLSGHCIVNHRDSFIVIGGTNMDIDANGEESGMIFRFNVTTNSWQTLGKLHRPRTGHGCSMNENEEIIVTGGKSLNNPLKSSEKIKFTGPYKIETEDFTDLPVRISHHAQADIGEVQLFGGAVSNVGRNFVIEYEDMSWEMTNVTLPENLSYHHVTKYPAYLVKC